MPVFEGSNHCCFQPANGDGDGETFWNKFGTLGRKKKEQEVKEVVAEGNYAIDSPGMPKSAEMPPEVTEILTLLIHTNSGGRLGGLMAPPLFLDQWKQVCFQQTSNQGLRQM